MARYHRLFTINILLSHTTIYQHLGSPNLLFSRIEQFEKHLAQNSDDDNNMICQSEFRELCFGGI